MTEPTLAWHFTDGMAYRDGTPLVVGQPCQHIEDIKICERGYHGSEDIRDAQRYAPGLYLSRTAHSGVIVRQVDKLCSQDRVPLWTMDARAVLIVYAQSCAESARISAAQANAAADADAAYYATNTAYAAAYAANSAARAAATANAAYYATNAAYAAAYDANSAARAAVTAAAAYYATNAAYAAAYADAVEREWRSVVLLQLASDEYDRLCAVEESK